MCNTEEKMPRVAKDKENTIKNVNLDVKKVKDKSTKKSNKSASIRVEKKST